MKCQNNMCPGENKKNVSKCRLLKILPTVLSVKVYHHSGCLHVFKATC